MKGVLVLFLALVLAAKPVRAEDFHTDGQIAQAQAEAREQKLPIAWVSAMRENVDGSSPQLTGTALLALALKELPGHAVVILSTDEGKAPELIHRYLFMRDDPDVPAPHTHFAPKIVLTDPSMTVYFDRISYTDMKEDGEGAFLAVFNRIAATPAFQDALNAPAAVPTASAAVPAPSASAVAPGFDFSNLLVIPILGLVLFVGYSWYAQRKSPPED